MNLNTLKHFPPDRSFVDHAGGLCTGLYDTTWYV